MAMVFIHSPICASIRLIRKCASQKDDHESWKLPTPNVSKVNMPGIPPREQEIHPKDPDLSGPGALSTCSWREIHQVTPSCDSFDSLF